MEQEVIKCLMDNHRIGILGGTFNPVHNGHLKAAETVIERFFLDRILFIPSFIPPHKENAYTLSPEHRFNMVSLALAGRPDFVPSRIEIDAREKSYSIITLNKIKKLNPDSRIFFILGIDAFVEIDTWKDYTDLINSCSFIVISRPGFNLKDAKRIIGGKYAKRMIEIESSINEKDIERYDFFLLHMESLDIASSDIRKKIKKGESIQGMVPYEVEKYIKEKKLYS